MSKQSYESFRKGIQAGISALWRPTTTGPSHWRGYDD
jgi:hypothetical protein